MMPRDMTAIQIPQALLSRYEAAIRKERVAYDLMLKARREAARLDDEHRKAISEKAEIAAEIEQALVRAAEQVIGMGDSGGKP